MVRTYLSFNIVAELSEPGPWNSAGSLITVTIGSIPLTLARKWPQRRGQRLLFQCFCPKLRRHDTLGVPSGAKLLNALQYARVWRIINSNGGKWSLCCDYFGQNIVATNARTRNILIDKTGSRLNYGRKVIINSTNSLCWFGGCTVTREDRHRFVSSSSASISVNGRSSCSTQPNAVTLPHPLAHRSSIDDCNRLLLA